MKNLIIFGNGINDLLLKRNVININDYVYQKINELLNKLANLCNGLIIIDNFIAYVKNFNQLAFKAKWKFDLLYTMPFEFKEFDNSHKVNFHKRLQDMIKSVLNSWLIEEFDIWNQNPTSKEVIEMINFFEYKLTTNYVIPKTINELNNMFLHGSFYKNDFIRRRSIKKIKNNMYNDKYVENWHIFFQKLKYVHLSNKYGLGEIKNMDNLKNSIGSNEEKKIEQEYTKLIAISKRHGFKTSKIRSLKKDDYESYNDLIMESNVIIIYGINPSLDEHLIRMASTKCKKLIFVWYSNKDKKMVKKIIDNSKDKLVQYQDFIQQYNKIDLLLDDFHHNH